MSTRAQALAALALGIAPLACHSASDTELQELRKEIDELRQSYEARLKQLEDRLKKAEAGSAAAPAASPAPQAAATAAVPVATPPPNVASTGAPSATTATSANAFNPAISLILSGTYASLSQDPGTYRISGFVPSGAELGKRGFSLGESELGISANVDPYFFGSLTVAVQPDNAVEIEEAFVQTTALGRGLTAKGGRFYSSIGYLNDQHSHAWDFVDQPLAYRAFLGGQFADDGLQLKWLAPTDLYVELGAEIGSGRSFPGSGGGLNGAGAWALYGHVGGDVGESQTWRAGLSYLAARPRDRGYEDVNVAGLPVANAFSGNSDLWIADFVWKWAPDGNAKRTNFKFQTEYMWRRESGTLTYDTANIASTGAYASQQSGGYAQAVYQFLPAWRTGLRYDWLDSGTVDYGINAANLAAVDYRPTRWSWMLDFNPTEFSRIRLQLATDRSRINATDNQFFVQYQMSLGAHGAHGF